jgi:hypothetical protein
MIELQVWQSTELSDSYSNDTASFSVAVLELAPGPRLRGWCAAASVAHGPGVSGGPWDARNRNPSHRYRGSGQLAHQRINVWEQTFAWNIPRASMTHRRPSAVSSLSISVEEVPKPLGTCVYAGPLRHGEPMRWYRPTSYNVGAEYTKAQSCTGAVRRLAIGGCRPYAAPRVPRGDLRWA